jgi:hypothetical protein
MGELRTAWHAADSDMSRALCGDEEAVMVTAERDLVTCPQCLERLREEGDDAGKAE